MADYGKKNNATNVPKKADVIIQTEREISYKVDRLYAQSSANAAAIRGDCNTVLQKCDDVLKQCQSAANDKDYTATQISQVYERLSADIKSVKEEVKYIALQNTGICEKTLATNDGVKEELKYLSVQNECIFNDLTKAINQLSEKFAEFTAQSAEKMEALAKAYEEKLDAMANTLTEKLDAIAEKQQDVDYDRISDIVAENFDKVFEYDAVEEEEDVAPVTVDYDEIARRVAEVIPAQEVVSADYIASKVAEQIVMPESIDEEAFADKVASRVVIPEPAVLNEEALTEAVADKVVEKLAAEEPAEEVEDAAFELDYDKLAEMVAEKVTVPQMDEEIIAAAVIAKLEVPEIDQEAIAAAVAEKIEIPQVDEDKLAAAVAEKIEIVEVDETKIANNVADQLSDKLPTAEPASDDDVNVVAPILAGIGNKGGAIDVDELADEIAKKLEGLNKELDVDELADQIAKKVDTLQNDEFDVIVDDEGCATICEEIAIKLDYDLLATKLVEKLAESEVLNKEPDYEEISTRIAEKVPVAEINEEEIANKAAAALSNYLPEFDTDGMADKVTGAIIPAIPAAPTVDTDEISEKVAEKVIANQAEADYDIVLDDEALTKLTEEVLKGTEEQLTKISEKVAAVEESVSAAADRIGGIDKELDELKALIIAGAVVGVGTDIAIAAANDDETAAAAAEPVEETEEELVTVSDLVDVDEEEPADEENQEYDAVIDEIVEDIDEQPVDGEVLPDGIEGISNSVDFGNMMKYNRSFIARIIQGSDDVKLHYGQTKDALLSYKKVNSSIAWGAERFNKGRETIAKFKIRGKTLCLYLALDPNEYKTSVYHHVDVSDNKSMKGTPMMVKIKSPLGVKKAIRLIDEMLEKRNGIKQNVRERDYVAMYPYETIEELIEDGLVKDVSKN